MKNKTSKKIVKTIQKVVKDFWALAPKERERCLTVFSVGFLDK